LSSLSQWIKHVRSLRLFSANWFQLFGLTSAFIQSFSRQLLILELAGALVVGLGHEAHIIYILGQAMPLVG
jgi:hypothetical protein